MNGYRLSALRSKGWIRLSVVGAVAMIPLTGMQYAVGLFSEGPRGLQQAAEYLASGVALAMILGLSAAWVAHGFAVKAKDSEDEEESSRRRPAIAAPSHPTPHSAPHATVNAGTPPTKGH